jgi:hypothetical protein
MPRGCLRFRNTSSGWRWRRELRSDFSQKLRGHLSLTICVEMEDQETEMENQSTENKKLNYIYHQERLIFQRLNYFLIGMAFLITAFASLVVGIKIFTMHQVVLNLILIIFFTAYFLSYFFTFANYLMSQIISSLNRAYMDNPNEEFIDFIKYPSEKDKKIEKLRCKFIWFFIRDSYYGLTRPFSIEGQHTAQHTWLIPAAFVLMWISVWIFVIVYLLQIYCAFWLYILWFAIPIVLLFLPFILYYVVTGIECLKRRNTLMTSNIGKQIEMLYKEADVLRKEALEKWHTALSGKKPLSNISQPYQISISRILVDIALNIEDYSMHIQGKPMEWHEGEIEKYRRLIQEVKKFWY